MVGEELHPRAPFVLRRANATSVYSVLHAKCFVSAHHPLPLAWSSISALWIINYTEFSSAFILLSCGYHLPTEGKKKTVSSL